MDLKEIQNLIKFVAKSGASEVKLEMEDIKLTMQHLLYLNKLLQHRHLLRQRLSQKKKFLKIIQEKILQNM